MLNHEIDLTVIPFDGLKRNVTLTAPSTSFISVRMRLGINEISYHQLLQASYELNRISYSSLHTVYSIPELVRFYKYLTLFSAIPEGIHKQFLL
jgi:hypothetical protein